jgi:hypothetical protein
MCLSETKQRVSVCAMCCRRGCRWALRSRAAGCCHCPPDRHHCAGGTTKHLVGGQQRTRHTQQVCVGEGEVSASSLAGSPAQLVSSCTSVTHSLCHDCVLCMRKALRALRPASSCADLPHLQYVVPCTPHRTCSDLCSQTPQV